MPTVTYHNQPGIDKTRGNIPIDGTDYPYKVTKVLWPKQVESFLETLLIPKSIHLCCGESKLGDIRVDLYKNDTIKYDAAKITDIVSPNSYKTSVCDPPYNGKMQWNHDLLTALAVITSHRIIFQHWFIPATRKGYYRKNQSKFALSNLYLIQPISYFGRVQVISVFDRIWDNEIEEIN